MAVTGTTRRAPVLLAAVVTGLLAVGSGCASVQETLKPTVPLVSTSGSPSGDASNPAAAGTEAAAGAASTTPAPKTAKPRRHRQHGARLAGKGYSFALPKGWSEATDQFRAISPLIDVAARDTTGVPGRAGSNINVIVRRVPSSARIDQGATTFYRQVKARSKSVRRLPDTRVAGARALHFSAVVSIANIDVPIQQFDFIHGSRVYVATVTFTPAASHKRQSGLVHTLIGSWRWGGATT